MRRQSSQGFSLLELIIVIVLIGLMSITGIKYFLDAMDKAGAASVEVAAWRFSQAAFTLHAWRHIPLSIETHKHGIDARGVRWIELDGTRIYLNEKGWPASTDSMASPRIGEQTRQGCEQLLQALVDKVISDGKPARQDFIVSAIDGRICRYQLAQNKEEAWFFDYSLETGQVQLSVPRLRIEQYAGS
jgi:prepilin-type N-terminal cleavage/methylation domain-containing protein